MAIFKTLSFPALIIAMLFPFVSYSQVSISSTNYTTLKAAFDSINSGIHTGAITITITNDVIEPGIAILNASGMGAASYSSVTIVPQDSSRIYKLHCTTGNRAYIELNGADHVTIDGTNPITGNGGRFLRFIHPNYGTYLYNSVIRMTNDARNNLLKNCIIEHYTNGDFSPAVMIGPGTLTEGNDSNEITGCLIQGESSLTSGTLACGIISLLDTPETKNASQLNDHITIRNNEFDRFANDYDIEGIWISEGSGNYFTIDSNRFYQSLASPTQGFTAIELRSTTSGGNKITANSFGGSAPDRSGAPFKNYQGEMVGILVRASDSPPTEVNGNLMSNLYAYYPTLGDGLFYGIRVIGGTVNVGTEAPNIMGGAERACDTIGSGSSIWGVSVEGPASGDTGVHKIRIENNRIGNMHIRYAGYNQVFKGIYVSHSNAHCIIKNNSIHDVTANYNGYNTVQVDGIYIVAHKPDTVVIHNNTIKDIRLNLLMSTTNFYGQNTGIYINGAGIKPVVTNNRIFNLTATGSAGTELTGISFTSTDSVYCANNQVALYNISGNRYLTGISQGAYSTGQSRFYHNSVFLSGSTDSSASVSAFAKGDIGTTVTAVLKNNVFCNRIASSNSSIIATQSASQIPTIQSSANVFYRHPASTFAFEFSVPVSLTQYRSLTSDYTSDSVSQLIFHDSLYDLTPALTSVNCALAGNALPSPVKDDNYGYTRYVPADRGAVEFSHGRNITLDYGSLTVCPRSTVYINVGMQVPPSFGYQWQVNNGMGWQNLAGDSITVGVHDTTLVLFHVDSTLNGNYYRCVMSDGICITNVISDSTTEPLIVLPAPHAYFTFNDAMQCLTGNVFTLKDSTVIDTSLTYTRLWKLGNNTDTAAQITRSYTSPGKYTVTLVSTADNGCVDSVRQQLTVLDAVTSAFTINQQTQCLANNNFIFIDTTNRVSGSRLWKLNDSSTVTTDTLEVSYSSTGIYQVKLIAIDSNGCADSSLRTVAVVSPPQTGFVVNDPVQCLNLNQFTFTDTTRSAGLYTRLWFIDGEAADTASALVKQYDTAGAHIVKMIVGTSGCSDSVVRSISVLPVPAAGFTFNTDEQCLSGNSFVFTDTSVNSNTLYWNLGDSSTALSGVVNKNYADPGNYPVSLVVTDTNGCADTAVHLMHVYGVPVSMFSVNDSQQCLNGNLFTVIGQSSDTSSALVNEWSFGDLFTSVSDTAVHTYAAPGEYTIKLVNTNAAGCKDSTIHSVSVRPSPVTHFSMNDSQQCLNGNSFTVIGQSLDTSSALINEWSFGDLFTSAADTVVHTYAAPGEYAIRLVTTNAAGCKDSASHSVSVSPSPVTLFSINDSAQCLKSNTFILNDLSGGTPGSWIVDGIYADTVSLFTHAFSTAGLHSIKRVSVTSEGCTDSLTQQVIVHADPLASVSLIGNDTFCIGNSVILYSVSTPGSDYVWIHNNIAIPGMHDSIITIDSAGSYFLIETNAAGCSDSSQEVNIVINNPPNAFFMGNTDVTRGDTEQYMANTLGLTYHWSVTSGVIVSGQGTATVSIKWTDTGHGQVSLEVSNASGCIGNDLLSVDVTAMNSGIEETGVSSFSIYPNPAANDLHIQGVQSLKNARISIRDMAGKLLIDEKVLNDTEEYEIRINELSQGMYSIDIDQEDGNTCRRKFIKM